MAAIFWESGGTEINVGIRIPVPKGPWGNLCHIGAFALLGTLWSTAFHSRGKPGGVLGLRGRSALLIACLYGLSDEIHQAFTPGRTSSVFDVVLDLGGAWVALALPVGRWPERLARPWLPLVVLAGLVALAVATAGPERLDFDRLLEQAVHRVAGR